MQGARHRLQLAGYSDAIVNTMIHSRRESSNRLYATHIKKWNAYCTQLGISNVFTTVPVILSFLQTLFEEQLSYSSINTAKAAVNTCIMLPNNQPLSASADVRTFMRGIFNLRPPLTKHTHIWDPDLVLRFMQSREGPDKLITEWLVKFLATLILLSSGQRPQILAALRIKDLVVDKDRARFVLQSSDIKQGRPGYVPPIISLRKYPHDEKICVLKYLSEYLKRTKHMRGSINQLFLTFKKPYHPATKNTLARWIKDVLRGSGVDTERYGAGSVRSAATSKAQAQGVPIDVIMGAAGWTCRSTFAKYYEKQISPDQDISSYVLP